jgi:hypothetical protein
VASWQTPVTGLTTNYRVRLRVFNNCCGWSAPVYHNFTVISTSVGPLANGDTICTGQTAALSAAGSGLGNLTWYADPLGQISLQTSAGASSTFTTPSLTQSAVYYVAESVSGCLTSLTAVQATVAPTPNPPAGSSAPVCNGLPVILNGFGTGGTLSWFNVASGGTALGTGTSFNAGNLSAGSYTFYLSESNGTCSSPRTALGALVNAAPAAPTASAATICSGNSTTLTATASGTVQVQLIAYQNNPSCADTAWTSIFVYDSVIVSVPNVFSPNNDNTNEFFGITSNTALTISGALVNRWGQTMVAWEDQVTSAGFTQLSIWPWLDHQVSGLIRATKTPYSDSVSLRLRLST